MADTPQLQTDTCCCGQTHNFTHEAVEEAEVLLHSH